MIYSNNPFNIPLLNPPSTRTTVTPGIGSIGKSSNTTARGQSLP
jgi:hypothetical protein